MMNSEESQRIWQLIKDIEVAMLTSERPPGLRARPMFAVQKKFDGTLWFITSESVARFERIVDNQQVCLTYTEEDEGIYVSLSGTASLVPDDALLDKFWNATAEDWFAQGRSDPDAVLLEVHVERAEIWDARNNAMTALFEPVEGGNYVRAWTNEYGPMGPH